MAKQKNSYYKGRKKGFTYYKWKGIPCCRKIAVGIKQTKATRSDSNIFKVASPMAKSFRGLFGGVIQYPKDRSMQLKWVGAVKRWLNARQKEEIPAGDLSYINGFQFHVESNLRDRLHVPVTVSPQPGVGVELYIPAFVPKQLIGAPAYTKSIKMKIVAASAGMRDGVAVDSYSAEITIPYNHHLLPEQTILLPLQSGAGTVSLVTIALEYTTVKTGEKRVVTDKKFIPCGIVGGWVNETVERLHKIEVSSKTAKDKTEHVTPKNEGQAPGLMGLNDVADWIKRTGYIAAWIKFIHRHEWPTYYVQKNLIRHCQFY